MTVFGVLLESVSIVLYRQTGLHMHPGRILEGLSTITDHLVLPS